MKNGFFTLPLFILFLAVSCEKDTASVMENEGLPLITKEVYSEEFVYEFTYNEQNLLKERKSRWFYTRYHYNSTNRLLSADFYEDPGIYSSNWETAYAAFHRTEWVSPENTQKSSKASYTYKNEILESVTILRIPGGTLNKTVYEYDLNGRIVNQLIYYEGNVSGRKTYTYDEFSNVSKEEYYSEGVLLSTRLFEYDNMHNPFYVFRHLKTPGIYTNENNIIKETQIIENNIDPNIETVQVTESVYEYNDKGYPVTKNGDIRYEYN